MNILEQLGITQEELINRTINTILKVPYDFDWNGNPEELGEPLYIHEAVEKALTTKINGIVDSLNDKITEKIDNIIDEKLEEVFTIPFQPVNRWGEKKGGPITVKDKIMEEALTYWNTKVNNSGKVSDSYGEKQTRAEYYTKKIATEIFDKEIREASEKMIKDIKTNLKDKTAEIVAESMSRFFR